MDTIYCISGLYMTSGVAFAELRTASVIREFMSPSRDSWKHTRRQLAPDQGTQRRGGSATLDLARPGRTAPTSDRLDNVSCASHTYWRPGDAFEAPSAQLLASPLIPNAALASSGCSYRGVSETKRVSARSTVV